MKREERMGSENEANTKETILVIETNEAILQLLIFSLQLAHYPYYFVEIQDIPSLAWIKEKALLQPDAIIFDVDSSPSLITEPLEFFHGFCSQWKTSSTLPPLVLLTNNNDTADTLGREFTVVRKPFINESLLSALRMVLGKK